MPWEAILGGATGGAAVAIMVGVLFLKSLTEKVVDAAQARFESSLKRAEELHRSTLALSASVDTDLRTRRIEAYTDLWKLTGALPQWPRNRELTYEDLRALTGEFRLWYFGVGGMYLSVKARAAYGQVQEALAGILAAAGDGAVTDAHYDAVRGECSRMRTELTQDLLSRREAPGL